MEVAHLAAQVAVLVVVERHPVQQDVPCLWLIEALQQTHAGALPTTRGPHQRSHSPRTDLQRHILEEADEHTSKTNKPT